MLHATEPGHRPDPVGQPAPAVLAVADPVRDRLDGREPLRRRCRPRSTASCCSRRRSPTTSCRRRSSATRAPDSVLAHAVGRDIKGKSRRCSTRPASGCRSSASGSRWPLRRVALIWLVPDRRIERTVTAGSSRARRRTGVAVAVATRMHRSHRVAGALVGSAVGDALGAPFEFGQPGQFSAPLPADRPERRPQRVAHRRAHQRAEHPVRPVHAGRRRAGSPVLRGCRQVGGGEVRMVRSIRRSGTSQISATAT